jgi:WD40 repeat protein
MLSSITCSKKMASLASKVFISYNHADRDWAEWIAGVIERAGCEPILDVWHFRPGENFVLRMQEAVTESDLILAVLSESYLKAVYTQSEWAAAFAQDPTSKKRRLIPVRIAECALTGLLSQIMYIDLVDLGEEQAERALFDGLKPSGRPVQPPSFPGKRAEPSISTAPFPPNVARLYSVPDLPPHYLPREDVLGALKQRLLLGDTSVAITGQGQALGIQGMGGIGKSVLAAAVARDLEVRQAFSEGIYWLTLGQKPNLLDLQNRLLRQLAGSKETLISEQEAKDALREALEGRSALVVVDDAWMIDHADAFLVTAPPARLLITTRNNEILVGIGAEGHRLGVLSPADALRMLANWVEQNPDGLPPQAAEVARECGYLPLALAMIGAMVRLSLRPTAWQDALTRLRRRDLAVIKRAFPGYPYPDLLHAIEVSVEALDEIDREHYLDLAVFPPDQPIPESALRVLWKLDEINTRDCMTRLVARSLASWSPSETTLFLHDLQRDLIHKRREKNLAGLHLRLLEAWNALPKLPDNYAWRWVAYHLAKAGREEDLRRLLLDFDYLHAKVGATDPNALIADYEYLPEDKNLQLAQSAIRLSADILASDPRQLAEQLTGRLLGNIAPTIQALLKQAAERKASAWLRPLHPNLTPPGGPLIRTLKGHTGCVNAVAVTPDGRRAVSASADQTLRVWDLENGQTLRRLEGHTGWVNAVAMAADGRRVVSASGDETLRVWDLESGQTLRRLEGHTGRVRAVAITPDGRRAISASADQTLRVWDLESGQALRRLEGHTGRVRAVAITPDGRRAISASADRTLRVWDLESGQTVRELEGHADWINAVAVTADGCRAVSGSADQTLRVWDLESGQTVRRLEGHTGRIRGVVITPDGRRAISTSADGTLRVWCLESGQTVCRLEGHADSVISVAVVTDGRRAVSASADQTLRVWDLEGRTARRLENHAGRVRAVAVTPNGRRAISASADRTLRVWDLETGRSIRTLEGHTDWVRAVAVTPDGRRAVSASADRTLRVWDLESGQTVRKLEGHTDWVRAVAVTPDGWRIVSGSSDDTLRVWDLESSQTIHTLKGHTGAVYGVAVTPDGQRAISASYDQTLRVWNLESGRMVCSLEGHRGGVSAVAVAPDGGRAVSASYDQTLRLWDLGTSHTIRTLEGHTGWVYAVTIILDGRRAVSASFDQTLRVWDLENGKEITTFIGESRMSSCASAPDGRTIVGGDEAGRVHFLRLVEADETKPLIGDAKITLLGRKEQVLHEAEKPSLA